MPQVMSTARPFTYDDLAGMPADGYRREVIGGMLVVVPSPNTEHQRICGTLLVLLRQSEPPDLMVLGAPCDWVTPDGGSVEPDLLVVSRSDIHDPRGPVPPTATPLLVIEVLSPSNRQYDLAVKRELYERFGVPGYWVVDPVGPTVTVLHLHDGAYETVLDGGPDDQVTVDWPFPVSFRPAILPR